MDYQCFRIIDERGRIVLPAPLRELVGIAKNEVVQVTSCGKVIMINKANTEAEDPVALVQREEERRRKEREDIRNRMKSLIEQGVALDDVLNEAIDFML